MSLNNAPVAGLHSYSVHWCLSTLMEIDCDSPCCWL